MTEHHPPMKRHDGDTPSLGAAPDAAGAEVALQRQYYADTAAKYDALHLGTDVEHELALAVLSGVVDYLHAASVLDVGSGTGRVITALVGRHPKLRVVGVEPVAELRAEGHRKGIEPGVLVEGDATRLHFPDASFDIVCAFAVLHHIPDPSVAVAEMLRVARKAIFISDTNRFGRGRWHVRKIKQALSALGLWRAANRLKTAGRGYSVSAGDGVAYSYSVFDNYRQIRRHCRSVHIINTQDARPDLYDSAPAVALIGVK